MKLTPAFLIVPLLSSLAACQGPPPAVAARSAAVAVASDAANAGSPATETCTCSKTYRSGRQVAVSTCDDSVKQCADIDLLHACDGLTESPCDLLVSCDCDCTGLPQPYFDHQPEDGVYLTGIPDLFQFDFMCGSVDPNFIGCGPIVLSSMYYWWAERGYHGLVDHHLTSTGLQAWRDLAKEIRADYASGICFSSVLVSGDDGEYAMYESSVEDTLGQYVHDNGYSQYTEHYRVCDDCNVDGITDLNTSDGLAVIQDELEAGRPVIMGFNTGTAFASSAKVDGETINTGNLSVGIGWIDHYGLITGYRRTSDGRDVVYMNTGLLNTGSDIALEWKPAGKWVHLFTLSIPESPDGATFCALDTSVKDTFSSPANVELSHADKTTKSSTRHFAPMAGKLCGVARDGEEDVFVSHRTVNDPCLTLHDIDVLNGQIDDVEAGLSDRGGAGLGGAGTIQTQSAF